MIAAGIKDHPITALHPEANSVCERMHLTVGNVLRTLFFAHPPTNIDQAEQLVDTALATAMHALRSRYSYSIHSSPGALVFGRDMFFDLPITADWIAIKNHRERLIEANLYRQNQKRRTFDYQPGQAAMIVNKDPKKMEQRLEGPYLIHQVHTNGTVTLVHGPHLLERINIKRLRPYARRV